MKLSRRAVLAALAATSCTPRSEPGPASPRFPLGVASGDASLDGALLWTRVEGTEALQVAVWPRGTPSAAVRAPVTVDDGGIAQHAAAGLEPGRWYEYRFELAGEASEVGAFRTLPAPGSLEPLTFGVSSCARQSEPLAPLARLAEGYALDAFLALGDTVYTDGSVTLDEYRQVWARGLGRWPNRQVRAATSVTATWDDHEILNNAAGADVDPAQLAAARRAFFEHMPVRPDAPGRIWRRQRWGDTAELFVLDCRGERNPEAHQYVSPEQLEWLKAGLAQSTARFKLVLNSVPISNYPGLFFQAFDDDRWEGYPAQRDELLTFVDANTSGVVWLTGDFHMGVFGRVALEGTGARQVEIACGPAGSNLANPAMSYPEPPQFDFATAINTVTVLDLDPVAGTVRARFVDGNGTVRFDSTFTPA